MPETQEKENKPEQENDHFPALSSLSQTMTTYTALSNRIRSATTREELAKREEQLDRHYHAGTITAAELSRLDRIIMNRLFFLLDTLPENPTITSP